MNKLALPLLDTRSSVYARLKEQDWCLDQNTLVVFNKALSKKLRTKHETIDRWKEKYDESYKYIRPLTIVKSKSVRLFNKAGSNLYVDAKRKSIHFNEVKPRVVDFRSSLSNMKEVRERGKPRSKDILLLTPRKWEMWEDNKSSLGCF